VKKLLFALGISVSLLCPRAAVAQSPEPPKLRVVHWNVFYDGKGTDGVRDRARQIAKLVAQTPDVITLNEVTANATVDYAVRLERATGVRWHHHHASAKPGGWGNAILSRYPLQSTSVYKMKVGQSRSVAQATISVQGATVNVFSTHLDSGDRPESRGVQAQELLDFVDDFAAPRIFAGDMNARPQAAEIRPLSASYDDLWMSAVDRGTARSYPSNPPHRNTRTRRGRLDYIFADQRHNVPWNVG
jgi:endonuclease/exonuclease/phosphatase family metal-dependent hydrolase